MTAMNTEKCSWFNVKVDSPRGALMSRRVYATCAAQAAASVRKGAEALGDEILRLYGADEMMTVTVTAE